jgi:hypothetical protein
MKTFVLALLVLILLYVWAANFAFQYRNPKANSASFFREFSKVMTWQKLDKYQ